jgi:hypothetical protein
MFTEVELEECSCVPEAQDYCASCQSIEDGLKAAEEEYEAYLATLGPIQRPFYEAERAARARRVKYLSNHSDRNGGYRNRYFLVVPDPHVGQPGDVETDDSDIEIPLTLESEMAIDEWIQEHGGKFPEFVTTPEEDQ